MQSWHPDGASPELTIGLLGSLTFGSGAGPIRVSARKGQALMAYLCRRPGFACPRETVLGLLWADRSDDQARTSLRQTLSGLRKELRAAGYGGLNADATTVALSADGLQLDTSRFEALQASRDVVVMAEADALWRGEFLEGFGALTPEFDRWLEAERGQLAARHAEMLLRLGDAWEAAGKLDAAAATAQRLLCADPLQEQVHRRIMRIFARQRRYDGALRQFDTLRSTLLAELGVAPEPATSDLAVEIRRQRAHRAPDAAVPVRMPGIPSPPQGKEDRPSIAVLPFRSLSANAAASLFAEGVAEEIIVELAREAGLRVVARASSFQLDHSPAGHSDVAERLGVDFVLSGSVRMLGERVRVTTQLSHVASGRATWAERYDRDLRDVFAIQTEIARTVTATAIGRIAEAEAEAAAARPFESLEGAALVAQGQRHFLSFTEDGFRRASDCFRRAAELSPGYARAHGLDAMARLYLRWSFELRCNVEDILPTAEQAVLLDSRDAKGRCALGLGNLVLRNFDTAAHHFELGLRSNPNDELLLVEYGRYLIYVDRPEGGLARVREAMALNPFHPNYYWHLEARCLHTLGLHAEALEVFARIEKPPFWTYVYLELCHRALGQEKAAQQARAAYRRLAPTFDLESFKATFPFRNPEAARHFFAGLEMHG